MTNFLQNRIFKNFAALSAVQVVNYLVPLLVVPLVLRVIGIERFGVVAFMQSVAMILAGICDYGYNIAATRRISIHREHKNELSSIVSLVLSTKLLLFAMAGLLMLGVHHLFPQRFGDASMLAAAMAIVLGNVLLPQWFFLGMEQMRYLTYLNTAAKILYLILIVLLLRQPEDAYLVLLLFGLSNMLFALIALGLIKKMFGISFHAVPLKGLRNELITGKPLFVSTLSTTSILNSNTFILGLFVQGATLGYFGVAEKIVLAMIQLLSTFSQATFPAVCSLTSRADANKAIKHFMKRHHLIFISITPLIIGSAMLLATPITTLMIGEAAPEAAFYLRLLLLVPLLIMFNIPPSQVLLAFGFNRTYQNIFLAAALLNLLLNLLGAYYFGATGTSAGMILTHIFLTSTLYIGIRQYHHERFVF